MYHFANECTATAKRGSDDTKITKTVPDSNKSLLGLYIESNILSKSEQVMIIDNVGDEVLEEEIDAYSDDELVLITRDTLEDLVLISMESALQALIDCACPSTVAGEAWWKEFRSRLAEEDQRKVIVKDSKKVYKFGGGEKRKSLYQIIFPCHFAGSNVKITTEIVDADFPLLLGNTLLKKAQVVLFFGEEKAIVMGVEVALKETNSGHFSVAIEPPKKDTWYKKDDSRASSVETFLSDTDAPLTLKDVEKLHHYFGHIPRKRLEDLIKKSDRLTDEVKNHLDHIELHCQSCKKNQKAKPRPVVALPRASKFNQVVTMDLKTYQEGRYNYICYLVDSFSRLTVGAFVENKLPSTVAAVILKQWMAPMGRMDMLHSDRGGEFCNEELTEVAEYLGVRSTFTAANSPNQNGVNERNHAICDGMIKKMRMQDPSLSAEVALTWALVAKNTLDNVSGFSPFQLVFGQGPKLPSVYTAGPPGLEEVVMSKVVADHINALHLAREAYIAGESDRILKTALKQRIYRRGLDIQIGDWIYFNNKGKWEGPVKVCAKDGKSLYVVRAGRLLTINADHADITMFEGEFLGKRTDVDEKEEIEVDKRNNDTPIDMLVEKNTVSDNAVDHTHNQNSTTVEVDNAAHQNQNQKSQSESKVKVNDMIRFKRADNEEWNDGQVVSRAGKATAKYRNWWNVKNVKTGHIQAEDLGGTSTVQKLHEVAEEDEDRTFVMTIPRHLHSETRCKEAKEKELNSWDAFDVYDEVSDNGQPRIGTNWVLTEKSIDGDTAVKARLTVRGDQEDKSTVRKDSPTVRKGNVKIFCVVAAKEGWDIKSIDATCAFLQGAPMERSVYILPPKERRVPGTLWELKKPVYGLTDAARGWYLALSEKVLEAGCVKCSVDPAMFIHFSTINEQRKLEGVVLSHVDDLLHGGSSRFQQDVMETVKSSFTFSQEESE